MKNVIEIDGHKAVISVDPEIGMMRGEFLGLTGGADFYAKDVDGRYEEGYWPCSWISAAKGALSHFASFLGNSMFGSIQNCMRQQSLRPRPKPKSLNGWVSEAIESAARAA